MDTFRYRLLIWTCRVLLEGETVALGEKPRGVARTNNKPNPCMVSTPGLYPSPHWWVVSALSSAPSLLSPPLPSPKKALVRCSFFLFFFFFLQRTLSVCPASATARYTSALQTCSTMMMPRIFCTLKCCLTMVTCWCVSVALQLFKTSTLYGSLYVATHLISG